MIAKVIINSNVKTLNKTFDYSIPKDMECRVFVGTKVKVPFGKLKNGIEGYVVSIAQSSNYEVKEILDVLDDISPFNLKLANWMSKKYFCNVSDCIKLMLSPATKDRNLNQKVKEKTQKIIKLNIEDNKDKQNYIKEKSKILKGQKQKQVLELFLNSDEITLVDIENTYKISLATIKTLEEKQIIKICQKQVIRDPLKNKQIINDQKKELTAEQKQVFDIIDDAIEDKYFQEYLIYGVTGSGKTEIYMQLIEKVISQDRSAIVLVPEISLTPQMVNRFIARFGKDIIAITHSKLSIGEKYDQYMRVVNGEAKIIIGPRSAIFSPVKNLGIIIIDEEHDSSYKSEQNPKYDTSEVAQKIAMQYNIPLVLGSATPKISTYYRALNGEIELLKLKNRANNSSLPQITIVDMKEELKQQNKTFISNPLFREIEQNLLRKEQTILYLNRRGFHTFMICKSCGNVLKCPNCDINLTYHKKQNTLKCHYCSYETSFIPKCPVCGDEQIIYKGCGTQKLEEQINQMFPNASTIRMDNDTTNIKNGHEKILSRFENEKIDILIGTQMVVKGHHFPNVTLVGVINADAQLNIEDYRAQELTYQILTQVSGRAGRENKQGQVIIQTMNPDNLAIKCATSLEYEKLYNTEIAIRKMLKYPPFCNIIVVNISSLKIEDVVNISEQIYKYLQTNLLKYDFTIFKPSKAPIELLQNRHRYRIIIKGEIDSQKNIILNKCFNNIYKTVAKTSVSVSCDLNPINMN